MSIYHMPHVAAAPVHMIYDPAHVAMLICAFVIVILALIE
jgi:hypothetical protein